MSQNTEKPENPFTSLIVNIAIPTLVLMKLSTEDKLGPTNSLILALLFPIGYALWDFKDKKKVNFISVLGFVNVLLTGGIGLLKLPPHWLAVKEAAVPALIGIVVLGSLKTKFPLVRKMIYNDKIIDIKKVDQHLLERGKTDAFDKLLIKVSILLSGSFFLSATLNYILAKVIVTSEPGTPAFNVELGKMTGYSYPVIVLPSMVVMGIAIWVLLSGIKKLTGLTLEDVFKVQETAKK
ncbi:MAG: MFS transporter [Zetaproteobacteria bacterium]|nr:MFS transporter [Pseudobdellovibrionaceae bacterium]